MFVLRATLSLMGLGITSAAGQSAVIEVRSTIAGCRVCVCVCVFSLSSLQSDRHEFMANRPDFAGLFQRPVSMRSFRW